MDVSQTVERFFPDAVEKINYALTIYEDSNVITCYAGSGLIVYPP